MAHNSREDRRDADHLMPDVAYLGALLEDEPSGGVHLCALCGMPIDDPLEECPTCAAEFESEDFAG